MKYQIFYLRPGRLSFGGRTIKPAAEYRSPKNIPVFDSKVTPITQGLGLLERAGKVEIRPFRKDLPSKSDRGESVSDAIPNDERGLTRPESNLAENIKILIDNPAEETEVSGECESAEDELAELDSLEDEDGLEEAEALEMEQVPGYSAEELREFGVKELNQLCKDLGMTGYSQLRKEEKIQLLLGHFGEGDE